MASPRKPLYRMPESGEDNSWMMTYSDLMSLLLSFFMILFAISKIDEESLQSVTGSFQSSFMSNEEVAEQGWQSNESSASVAQNFSTLVRWLNVAQSEKEAMEKIEQAKSNEQNQKKLKEYLSKKLKEKGVSRAGVESGDAKDQSLEIIIPSNVFFKKDQTVLKKSATESLTKISTEIKKLGANTAIEVIAHSSANKDALTVSVLQAARVANFLKVELGQDTLVLPRGMGSQMPLYANTDAISRDKNAQKRTGDQNNPNERVHIVIKKKDAL